MERLRIYLDNLFSGLPDTGEVSDRKAYILSRMEERYSDLLSQGKNEDEAFGIVVSEFDSIEEIKSELSLAEKTMEEYKSFKKKFALGIALGVFLCILAPVSFLATRRPLLFLLFVAAGVFLFVYFGILDGNYREILGLDRTTSANKKKADLICGVTMILATLAFLILGAVFNLWHPGWVVFPVGGLICAIVSIIYEYKS